MTDSRSVSTKQVMKLRRERRFKPCPTEPGDELYPNGIFAFNISRLLAFISAQPERFRIEVVQVSEIPDYGTSDRLGEPATQAADVSRKTLLAEIAPERFNLVDGHQSSRPAVIFESIKPKNKTCGVPSGDSRPL